MTIIKIPGRLALWTILASATLTVMAGSMLAPVVHLVREGLAVAPASAGFIITTHSLFVALFSPLMGNIIDRIGTRKPFLFGLMLYGLAGGSGLWIDSYWLLIVSRALLGIGIAAIFNSITVMILNLYEGVERNRVMGWRGTANSFGGLTFTLLGGALGSLSWHLPFAIYLVGIPLSFLAFVTIPQTQREKSSEGSGDSSVVKVIKNTPILVAIYGLMSLTMTFLYAVAVFLPQLLGEIGIPNPFHISLILTVVSLATALTSLMYGRIKSKLSYKMVVLIALALWTVGFTTISQTSSGYIIAASLALFGIGRGIVQPALPVWAGEIVPFSHRGRIISYLTTLGYVGQFSSPVLFGAVFSLLGFSGIFLIAGMLCVPVFLLFLLLLRR